jgi:hypothetical protein
VTYNPLIDLSSSQARTVIVQDGGDGEHQIVSVTRGDDTTPIDAPLFAVRLAPGCGQTLVLAKKRYANRPTVLRPWHRAAPREASKRGL